MVAVPKTFEEFLRVVQKKLGLPSVASVFTKNGGLIDDVELIRDDEVLYVSAEDVAMGMTIRDYFLLKTVLIKFHWLNKDLQFLKQEDSECKIDCWLILTKCNEPFDSCVLCC